MNNEAVKKTISFVSDGACQVDVRSGCGGTIAAMQAYEGT